MKKAEECIRLYLKTNALIRNCIAVCKRDTVEVISTTRPLDLRPLCFNRGSEHLETTLIILSVTFVHRKQRE